MEITFNNKEESNDAQRVEFLRLSHRERFYTWLNLMYLSNNLMPKEPTENNNFLIVIKK